MMLEILAVDLDTNAVQIHYINGHYVISCQRGNEIVLYDTIPNRVKRIKDLLPQLKTLYVRVRQMLNPK